MQSKKRRKVAIIGAGRGGTALLRLLAGHPDLEVAGVAEIDQNSPGLELVRQMGIPITHDYHEFAGREDLDLIVNVTGDPSIGECIEKEKKGRQEVLGGASARLLWDLVYNIKRREEEKEEFLAKLAAINRDLNATKEYLENVLEYSADIIITTSADSEILSFNRGAERILGYSREEVTGKKVEILWKEPEERNKLFEQLDRDGFVANFETELISRDKRIIHIILTLSYLKNQEGEIIGTVGISKDISEKKRVEMELLRSNRDLEDFVYTISHDLQSPLRGIYGFSKLLSGKYMDKLDETGLHYLSRIQKGTERMKLLIDDLLALSRINMQKNQLGKTDLKNTLHAVQDIFQLDLAARNGELLLPEKAPVIFCDRTRVQQVFNNLVSNALKFCKGNPRIEIGYTERKDEHEFYVKDNGIGIHPEYHHKIFKIFQRLHNDESIEGTGIGLTIVKKIIDLHRGRIWVDSYPDKGTTFYFTISRNIE